MLIWLHARDSTQSSLHSSFCTLLFLSVLWVPTLSFPDNTMFVRYLWCFKCLFPSAFLPLIFFLPHSLRLWHGVMLQGHFSARSDIKRFFLLYLQIEVSLSLSLSQTHTHISGINKSFHSLLGHLVWYQSSLLTNLIQLGKKRLPTWPLSLHALLTPHREEMKTNTVGFVLLQKAAALNLHGSSHTLPQVPVEAGQDWLQTKGFRMSFVYVVKCDGCWVKSSSSLKLINTNISTTRCEIESTKTRKYP